MLERGALPGGAFARAIGRMIPTDHGGEDRIRRPITMDGNTKPKKLASSLMLEANRRNSLRSTGPRTPQGKAAVGWNSLKHGLLAKEIVIPAGAARENPAEFHYLLAQLREHLAPTGILEEILVEKIAACYWRLRRVLRSEAGEIQKGTDAAPAARMRECKVQRLLGEPRATTAEEEQQWLQSEQASRALPTGAVLDKILRYETSVERQLYRALHQLERIQRRGRGEPVPPPVSVEFSA
jgi:hypothetical protein